MRPITKRVIMMEESWRSWNRKMWRSRDLRLRTVRQEETPESEVLHMPAKENVPRGKEGSICLRCCDNSYKRTVENEYWPRMWRSLVTLTRACLVEWWEEASLKWIQERGELEILNVDRSSEASSLRESREMGWELGRDTGSGEGGRGCYFEDGRSSSILVSWWAWSRRERVSALIMQETEGRLTEVMSLRSWKRMCPGAQVGKLVSVMSQDGSVLVAQRKAEVWIQMKVGGYIFWLNEWMSKQSARRDWDWHSTRKVSMVARPTLRTGHLGRWSSWRGPSVGY